MDNRDCVCLAHALAKAAVQPGVSTPTIEQCIYQIGLILASDDAHHFDLGTWRQLIEEHRDYLELATDQASFERDCLVVPENTGDAPTSCDPPPRACAPARRESS